MSNPKENQPLRGDDRTVYSVVTLTEAQKNVGKLLTRTNREGRVFISRYDSVEAVMLSMEEYESLLQPGVAAINRQHDDMLEKMQGAEHRHAVDRLFELSGRELGRIASGRDTDETD